MITFVCVYHKIHSCITLNLSNYKLSELHGLFDTGNDLVYITSCFIVETLVVMCWPVGKLVGPDWLRFPLSQQLNMS